MTVKRVLSTKQPSPQTPYAAAATRSGSSPWHMVLGLALAMLLVVCCEASAQQDAGESAPAGTVTSKLVRYARRIVQRHDTNGDGHLDTGEWAAMRGNPATADLDRDGRITIDEFARYVADHGAGRRIRLSTMRDPVAERNPATRQPGVGEAETVNAADGNQQVLERRRELKYFSQLPDGVPAWFLERDADGDAQLTLAEFSPKLRTAEVAEFKSYDRNGDGLLTAAESSGQGTAAPRSAVPATPGQPK